MPSRSGDTRLDPLEDQRLVELCLAGAPDAWESLVRRHERLVYAVARAYHLTEPDLADVFQEVFAALIRGLPRLQEPRALVRWLSSTTQRIARASALRARREAALALRVEPEVLTRIPSGSGPIGAELERLEEQALIRRAMATLPPRCQRLLTALYYEEPGSYAELSRRLGIPIGSIGPTRARCFERLRQAYTKLISDQPRISGRADATCDTESSRDVQEGVESVKTGVEEGT